MGRKENVMNSANKLLKTFTAVGINIFLLFILINFSSRINMDSAIPKDAALITPAQAKHASTKIPEATKQRVSEVYGRLPLSFEVNQGQTDSQVKFLSRGSGYTLFLTSSEAVLTLTRMGSSDFRLQNEESLISSTSLNQQSTIRSPKWGNPQSTVLRMRLVDANPQPKVVGMEELLGKSNYFIGNDPEKWHTDVPNYVKVHYEDVYPGIDLVYYGNQRQLEYDLVVHPGADPKAITLSFQGADKLEVNAGGDLVLHTKGGEIRQHKPLVYQQANGGKQTVTGNYVLKGEAEIGFQVAAYDTSKPLIIDPVLSYSTYLGGISDDHGFSVAVDSDNNAYVSGRTNSTNFPTTVGAFQTTNAGGLFDTFVTKLNSEGTALVYSTYLGGSNVDGLSSIMIAVDSGGNAYVAGDTWSNDFPTTSGALQTTFAGGQNDGFVTKLNSTGSALVYSTYLGGSSDDETLAIAIDSGGNAYVTGWTNSTNFPTMNPFQATFGGGILDAFVTKLNSEGTALVYSTYLGGSDHDQGNGIAVDSDGNAYVAGATASTNFPIANPIQAVCASCPTTDAFVTKLNSSGSALVYSTYLAAATAVHLAQVSP